MKSIPLIAALLSLVAAAPAPVPHVSTQRMSEITRVLASDEFQGRAPGTPGEEKTIAYLIEQFKARRPRARRREWRLDADRADDPHPAPGAGGAVRQPGGQTHPAAIPRRPLSRHGSRDRSRAHSQRANGVRRLRSHRARARLGRFQGRRPARQGRGLAGQRSRLRGGSRRAGGGQVRRQGDDLSTAAGRTSIEEAARRGAIGALDRPRDARPRAMPGTRCRRRQARHTTSCSAATRTAAGAAPGLDAASGRCRSVPPRRARFRDGQAAGANRRVPPDRSRRELLRRHPGRPAAGQSHNVHRQADRLETSRRDDHVLRPLGRLRDRPAPTRAARRSAPAPPTTRSASPAMLEDRAPVRGRTAAASGPCSSPPGPPRSAACSAPNITRRNPLYPAETMVANLTLDTLQSAGPSATSC